MMDIDIKGDGRYASSRRAAYKYSIDSWKKWCDRNDCELFVLNDLILDNDKMGRNCHIKKINIAIKTYIRLKAKNSCKLLYILNFLAIKVSRAP